MTEPNESWNTKTVRRFRHLRDICVLPLSLPSRCERACQSSLRPSLTDDDKISQCSYHSTGTEKQLKKGRTWLSFGVI